MVKIHYDKYNREADIPALLCSNGWAQGKERGDNIPFTRPGKDKGISGTWHKGLRVFYVFTTSSGFDADRAYNASEVLRVLECDGDPVKLAEKLTALGYAEDVVSEEQEQRTAKRKSEAQARRAQAQAARRFPLTMTIPRDRAGLPGLAIPNGQWRRAADGGMVVTFRSADELDDCIMATRACRESYAKHQ